MWDPHNGDGVIVHAAIGSTGRFTPGTARPKPHIRFLMKACISSLGKSAISA